MSRGILTVNEDMTFDEMDGLGQSGIITSLDQPMPASSAVAASPFAPAAVSAASTTPSFLTSITSILQSGAQAYGAYSAAKGAKKPTGPMMPMPNPYAQYGPSVAPTTAGLSGMQIALIVGGGVLLLGVGAMVLLKK